MSDYYDKIGVVHLYYTPSVQSIGRFGFSRYTTFIMIYKYCICKRIAKAMYIEKSKLPIIWDGGW